MRTTSAGPQIWECDFLRCSFSCCKIKWPSEGLNTNGENARWSKPLLMFSIRWPFWNFMCQCASVKTHSFTIKWLEYTYMSTATMALSSSSTRIRLYPLGLIVLSHNSIGPCSSSEYGRWRHSSWCGKRRPNTRSSQQGKQNDSDFKQTQRMVLWARKTSVV